MAVMMCNGCATILAGGPSRLDVVVQEPTASVSVAVRGIENDDERILRQATIQTIMERGSAYAVGASAPGYEPAVVIVKKTIEPTFWWNLAPMAVGLIAFGALVLPAGTSGGASSNGLLITGAVLGVGGEVVSLVGIGVDAITKNVWRHETQRLTIILEKANQGVSRTNKAQEPATR